MKTILVDAINTIVIKGEWVYMPLHELLETYQNPKIILTNALRDKMPELGLENMPYEVFTLEHEPDKTESEYYETMLNMYGFWADDVVYFEHNIEAVESARSAWIITHHYDPEQKDIKALKDFLDIHV